MKKSFKSIIVGLTGSNDDIVPNRKQLSKQLDLKYELYVLMLDAVHAAVVITTAASASHHSLDRGAHRQRDTGFPCDRWGTLNGHDDGRYAPPLARSVFPRTPNTHIRHMRRLRPKRFFVVI